MEIPIGLSGAITLAAFVGLGIFAYPLLLKRRAGALVVAVVTLVLCALYYWFDRSANADAGVSVLRSALLALLWAVLPVIPGVIIWRAQRSPGRRK